MAFKLKYGTIFKDLNDPWKLCHIWFLYYEIYKLQANEGAKNIIMALIQSKGPNAPWLFWLISTRDLSQERCIQRTTNASGALETQVLFQRAIKLATNFIQVFVLQCTLSPLFNWHSLSKTSEEVVPSLALTSKKLHKVYHWSPTDTLWEGTDLMHCGKVKDQKYPFSWIWCIVGRFRTKIVLFPSHEASFWDIQNYTLWVYLPWQDQVCNGEVPWRSSMQCVKAT